jgi:hypothetical protein
VDPARALSVLVRAGSGTVSRGGSPLEVRIQVQNTGAGHAVPTGSPWKAWRLEAVLEGPPDKRGKPAVSDAVRAEFARVIEAQPPWRTTADTRLEAGEVRDLSASLSLPAGAPAGAWYLRVSLSEVGRDADEEVIAVQRVPIRVD